MRSLLFSGEPYVIKHVIIPCKTTIGESKKKISPVCCPKHSVIMADMKHELTATLMLIHYLTLKALPGICGRRYFQKGNASIKPK